MTHNINLITKPQIFIVGSSCINEEGVANFTDFIEKESGRSPDMLKEILKSHHASRYSDLDLIPEIAGRVCYQSYFKGRPTEEYIDNIIEEKHGNVFEHSSINTIITGVSRSLSHELIRHKVGTGVSEMSQRFVGGNEKSGWWNFVVPAALREAYAKNEHIQSFLKNLANNAVDSYIAMKDVLTSTLETEGMSQRDITKAVNEAAREILPNMAETRLVWTFNMRIVRHILDKRGSAHADKQIREFSVELWDLLEELNLLSMKGITKTADRTILVTPTGV